MLKVRTEQIWLNPTSTLRKLAHYSKNLYNEANYLIRQQFFQTGQWLRYQTIWTQLKQSKNYQNLPAQTAQQVLRLLDRNWKAFFHAMKEWTGHPKRFQGRPRPPKYIRKKGEFLLIFTNQQVKIMNGHLHFPKKVGTLVKTRLPATTNLREVRVVPRGVGYNIEIVYEKEFTPLALDQSRVVSIDLGLTNLITMVNNIGWPPIIIKGGAIKSINHYYNKERARFFSIYDRQGNKSKAGKGLHRLANKRNRLLQNQFHHLSRDIIKYCVKNNLGTIVIGYNTGWKQRITLGKRRNQQFVTLPFQKLIHLLQYKAEEVGIQVVLCEEQYTSKCSFLDNEPINKQQTYQGQRISRSWFRTSAGILVHADVNGAYNIMKKALPKAISVDGIEAVGLQPIRWRLATATG